MMLLLALGARSPETNSRTCNHRYIGDCWIDVAVVVANRQCSERGELSGMAGGFSALQQHRQPPAGPPTSDSTDPKVKANFRVTSTSSRSNLAKTQDPKTS